MKRLLLRLAIAIPLTVVAVVAAILGYATYLIGKRWDVPYPAIRADLRPESVAHGAAIFHSNCAACHHSTDSDRAAGKHLGDIPKFLGSFDSANLTSDRIAGVGARSDKELARMIRFSVNHEGRKTFMPSSPMSDADLASVLGFIRSGDPLFAPSPRVAPQSRVSAIGRLLLFASHALTPPSRPTSGIIAPPKAATVAYGSYLARQVYACGDCHTSGFSPDKEEGKQAFAGGFELQDASGQPIITPNLTFDQTGLAKWSVADLHDALHDGVRPDGTALKYPMPRFRGIDEVDAEAIHRYLESLPHLASLAPPRRKELLPGGDDPRQDFAAYGCINCHGEGALYHDKLAHAKTKSPEEIAKWIRNPERYKPGTEMPTYEARMNEATALRLAKWVQSL